MELTKVKEKDLPAIKKELIKRQHGKCPITGRDLRVMSSVNVVVDHSHKSGVIRAALPRAINGVEGKIKNLLIRWGKCETDMEMIQMLEGLAAYWRLHRIPQTEWLHPKHLTPAEARVKKNAAARKRYAKSKEA